MRTSKPISTITYNTQDYLVYKLEELVKAHKISNYMFINHFKESDEKKDHIHLYMQPNGLIDTMYIQDFLKEIDPKNPTKPLGCIDFHTSNPDDWILYNQHYEPYLASKFEKREFSYSKDDFVFYDEDTFEELYKHAFKGSEWSRRYQILEALNNESITPTQLIMNGTLPLQAAGSLRAFMFMVKEESQRVDRGGRKGHD